jgi:endonuclease YncB( thermonuclease family)
VAIALLTAVVALFWPPQPSLSGRAHAIDGDTLRIGETRIRLTGLDAVERDQSCTRADGTAWACGRDAGAYLGTLVDHATITCVTSGRDLYRRVLARCTAGGNDLGEQMVRAGWAVAELDYALPLADARLHARGIWSGQFDDPAQWRRSHGAETFDLWAWLMGVFGR